MANLRILVPEATVNYITNPSMRYDTTGWGGGAPGGSGSLTRVLTDARFGISSLQVTSYDAVFFMGTSYRVSSLSGYNGPITASVYVRGSRNETPSESGRTVVRKPKIRLRLIINPTGRETYSKAIMPSQERWTRLTASGMATGSNDIRLYVECVESPGVTHEFQFLVDGAQIERKAYPTTYCDGDQPGCRWNLTAHESTSSRDAFTREGGRWVDLAGPCRPNDNLYVTVLGGLGMAPIANNIQPWGNAPGSYYQNNKILDRVVTLSFHAKNQDLRLIGAPKLNKLHELRQQLIDIIKPDRTQGSEAFWFEYDEGERPLYMRFRYEAGLEGEWDVRNQWINSFPVRLLAVDPIWVEDNQNVADVDFLDTIPLTGSEVDAFRRVNGIWDRLKNSAGATPTDVVSALAIGPKGELYLGGNFTNIGNRIVKWDGTNYTELGVGGANGAINAIAVGLDGSVYATGAFTAIGGVACTRVAKYNPTTNTWSALSTGLNDVGRAVCVAPNGQVYIGGDFTQAGGVTMNYITRWDGLQFRTVGAPTGFNNSVYSLINSGDKQYIYIGGLFTAPSAGASPAFQRIAKVDLSTNLLSVVTDNAFASGTTRALAVGLDGTLYAAVDGSVYYLDGRVWTTLATFNTSSIVYALSVGLDGTLYMGGSFSSSGTTPTARLARWTKGEVLPLDLIPSKTASPIVYALLAHPNGDLYVGLDAVTTASYASGITTVTNTGSAEVAPTIYVSGSGILRFLENWTTKKRVYFNLTIFAGEEVFIDFARSAIYSTTRGNLYSNVLNGSDFKAFTLLPGDNQIAAFMTDDVGAQMKIGYVPQHWSADAVVDAEAL